MVNCEDDLEDGELRDEFKSLDHQAIDDAITEALSGEQNYIDRLEVEMAELEEQIEGQLKKVAGAKQDKKLTTKTSKKIRKLSSESLDSSSPPPKQKKLNSYYSKPLPNASKPPNASRLPNASKPLPNKPLPNVPKPLPNITKPLPNVTKALPNVTKHLPNVPNTHPPLKEETSQVKVPANQGSQFSQPTPCPQMVNLDTATPVTLAFDVHPLDSQTESSLFNIKEVKSFAAVNGKYVEIRSDQERKIPPLLLQPPPPPQHQERRLAPNDRFPAQIPPSLDMSAPLVDVEEGDVNTHAAPRRESNMKEEDAPLLAVNMLPSHLLVTCQGLEVSHRLVSHQMELNKMLGCRHNLMRIAQFDPVLDTCAILKPRIGGPPVGVSLTLRHFGSDAEVYAHQASLQNLTGGFLGLCVIKTVVRYELFKENRILT